MRNPQICLPEGWHATWKRILTVHFWDRKLTQDSRHNFHTPKHPELSCLSRSGNPLKLLENATFACSSFCTRIFWANQLHCCTAAKFCAYQSITKPALGWQSVDAFTILEMEAIRTNLYTFNLKSKLFWFVISHWLCQGRCRCVGIAEIVLRDAWSN